MFTREPRHHIDDFAARAQPSGYALAANAFSTSDAEVERDDADELSVVVLWGSTVLATRYLGESGSVVVGDAVGTAARMPKEALGDDIFTIATASRAGFVVNVPAGAAAFLSTASGERAIAGPARLVTARGDRVVIELGVFRVRVAHEAAGKRLAAVALLERVRSGALAQVLGAAFLHAAVLYAFGYHMPGLASDEGNDEQADTIAQMMPYLVSAAERERQEEEKQEALEAGASGDRTPSGGGRAAGAEGKLGREGATSKGRYGVEGPKDNPDPHLARERAIAEARNFGVIGVLAQLSGDPNSPTAPFGGLTALGVDPKSALGGMCGSTTDDAAGIGGLGISGIGEGGGGTGVGIGINGIEGLGHDIGRDGPGFGPGGVGGCRAGEPCGRRAHNPGAPQVRMAIGTEVNGHIPAEVIQRIVRQNFGRFRSCYESGLRDNPSLAGRVVTRFAVTREGTVSQAVAAGGDLPNAAVTACVTRAFYGLSFPEHEGGIVTVIYPLAFSPE